MGEIILYSSLAVFTVPFIWFVYKIITSDFLYLPEKGTWKNGINLTSLHAGSGDKIDHYRFKLFVGLNLLLLILVVDVTTIWLYNEISAEYITEQEILDIITVYTLLLLIGCLIPIILLYSKYKEKYIERVSSTPPRSHKFVVRFCVILCVILGLCLLPFI